MTFEAKYEIEEAVAGGRVETFLARRINIGDRVVVHIFECPEQKPNQPTIQWVTESFRAITPEPVGLVIDAGGYLGTSFAYLVTKLPETDRLQQWVRLYQSGEFQVASAELSSGAARKRIISPETTPFLTAVTGGAAPHSVTVPFEAVPEDLAPTTLAAEGDKSGNHLLTELFDGSIPEKSGRAESRQRATAAPTNGASKIDERSDQASGFFANAKNQSDSVLANGTGSRIGDLAQIFSGPFSGEEPQPFPKVSRNEPPPEKKQSEFSKVFGSQPQSGAHSGERGDGSGNVGAAGDSITSMLVAAEGSSRPASTVSAPQPGPAPEIGGGSYQTRSAGESGGHPNGQDFSPKEAAERTTPDMRIMVDAGSSADDGSLSATQVLAAGRAEPHEVLPNISKAPSDFTKIVWGGKRVSSSADGAQGDRVQSLAALREPIPSSGSPLHLNPLPDTPLEPSMPSDSIIPDGASGGVARIQLQISESSPGMAGSAGQQLLNTARTSEVKPAVPWTMILILNGIFVLAVLVVLYFAVRR